MKNQRIRKLISFISSFTLLLQSFLPLVYVTPVYADDTSVIASDSAAIQNPETTPTPEITPEPTVTVTPTESITPSVSSTSSSAIAIPPQAGVAIPDNGVTSTSDDKSATFDNVSEGQTYTSKDGKATVTFSEITGPSGNLVIKEITLTPEQIAQSGAVSEVAYDITSSMADGTFKYNLTLPKPDSQNIEVKYSEDGNNFVTSGGVSTTDDSVVVSNVDHFTIFIVSATLSPTATLNNLSQVTVYPNETIKVTLKVELNKLSGWGHSEWKIGNGSWNSINTPDHLNLIYWSTDNFSENFDISAPSNVGTYDVSFNVCPLNPQNSCANITLTSGIIVKSFCGNGQLDINEKCDDGNTINGDGCSNSCIIEDNWKCNTNSPSICRVIVPPTVTIVDPSPIENSYVNGDIVGHVKATDDDGMGSYYLRFWKNAFESGTPNLMRECSLAPGGSALGNIQDVNCSLDTKTVSDGTYVFSAQFLDNDTKWGQATRTFYVDNHAPIVSIKTESGINDGSLGNNGVYSRISFKLNDPNGGLASVVFNGNTYIRTGEWNSKF